jgi:hypothetical protein
MDGGNGFGWFSGFGLTGFALAIPSISRSCLDPFIGLTISYWNGINGGDIPTKVPKTPQGLSPPTQPS